MNHNYVGADPYRWPYDGDLQHGVDSDSLTGICCNFVVEPKVRGDKWTFSWSPRTDRE
jgi:hypothetical protein